MTQPLNDCTEFEPKLSAHLLGELPDDDKTSLDEHLAACETCRAERALLESAAALIAEGAPSDATLQPEERGRILEAAAVSRRPRQARGLLRGVAVGAAAAIIVGVGIWLLSPWLGSDSDPGVGIQNVSKSGAHLEGELLAQAEPTTPRKENVQWPEPMSALSEISERAMSGSDGYGREELPGAAGGGGVGNGLQPDIALGLGRSYEKGPELMLKPQGVQPPGKAAPGALSNESQLRKPAPDSYQLRLAAPTTPSPPPPPGAPDNPRRFQRSLYAEGLEAPRGHYEPRGAGETKTARESLSEAVVPSDGNVTFPSKEEWEATREKGGESRQDTASLATLESALRSAREERGQVLQDGERLARNTKGFRLSADGAMEESKALDATPLSVESAPATGPVGSDPTLDLLDAAGGTPDTAGRDVTKPVTTVDWKARVNEILSRLDRRPGESPSMMFFRYWGNNPFVEASADRLSTFGVDCDTASYTLARSYIYKRGLLPPKEAVRLEEFINYFKSHYAPPTEDGRAFAVHAELAPSPFAHEPEYRLLKVGLKGREVPRAERKACSLVFVIDTSGSMRQESRLELVKDALRMLVGELDEGDTIGIVEFSTQARKVLDPVSVAGNERILDALSRLQPQNSTNVGEGLRMGYRMAVNHKLSGGVNRVILLSDGVANTGTTQAQGILDLVRSERERGIYLTTVGVGMGNHNDTLLEQLADRGNGQCVYVDRVEEARKVFVDNLTGTLETIAKDVKIQVEFDPKRVIRYRLLGYENRDIADHKFRDNTVDAGEVGAGHEVTALYELKLQPGEDASRGKVATVRVRYLTVDHGEAVEYEKPVEAETARNSVDDTSPCFRLSACAAELAEVLRESYWARGANLAEVASLLETVLPVPAVEGGRPLGEDPDVVELVALVRKADALVRQRRAQMDDIARAVDAIKDNHYLRARIEGELARRQVDDRTYLHDLQRQNDDLRRKLEELLTR